jgi:hypothetical protein
MSRPSSADWKAATGGEEQRTRVGRFLRFFVAPWLDALYYWFDLRKSPSPGQRQGHPDHNKVLSTIAFFFGLIGVGMFGTATLSMCVAVLDLLEGKNAIPITPEALSQLTKSCALMTTALLGYAALVFGMAFGLSGFRVWAKGKASAATAEALGKVAAEAVNEQIAARRQQGGDYEVTD